MKNVADVSSAVLGNDFLYQVGFSAEKNMVLLSIEDPRIQDDERAGTVLGIPATIKDAQVSRYIIIKAAYDLYQIEVEEAKQGPKPKLEVVKSNLIVPGK
jgi:hypothetical protein